MIHHDFICIAFPGSKVVLTQAVNMAQVQAQAAGQVVAQSTPNHLSGKRISNQAAQLSQLSQMSQVVGKTASNQRLGSNSQLSITQTSTPQVSITQTGQVVTQTGQVPNVVQFPSGVVQLNNMPIVVRPPPPREMRNKSVQCKPPEDEDQHDIDRISEAVTGKSVYRDNVILSFVDNELYQRKCNDFFSYLSTEKPLLKGVLLDIELLKASLEGEKVVEFELELKSLAKKLMERLQGEPKVNGGVNNHEGQGGKKRAREHSGDSGDGQGNCDSEGDKENKKRFKDESQEIIEDSLQKWTEWAKQRKGKTNDCDDLKLSSEEFAKLNPEEMNQALCAIGKDTQEDATADDILRLVKLFLGLQLHLQRVKHKANIFNDGAFCAFNDYLVTLTSSVESEKVVRFSC